MEVPGAGQPSAGAEPAGVSTGAVESPTTDFASSSDREILDQYLSDEGQEGEESQSGEVPGEEAETAEAGESEQDTETPPETEEAEPKVPPTTEKPDEETKPLEFGKFKEAFKQYPGLREFVGQFQGIIDRFGNPKNVLALAEIVPTVEDAQRFKQGAEMLDFVNSSLDSPDPEDHDRVIESIQEDSPERLANITAAILRSPNLSQLAPDAARKIFVENVKNFATFAPEEYREFARENYEGTLERHLTRAQAEGNEDLAYWLTQALHDARRSGAAPVKPKAQPDPEKEEMRRKLAEVETRQRAAAQERAENFDREVVTGVRGLVEKDVDEKLAGKALPEGIAKRMRAEIIDAIFEALSPRSNFSVRARLNDVNASTRKTRLDDAHRSDILGVYTQALRQVGPGIVKKITEAWSQDLAGHSTARLQKIESVAGRSRDPGTGSAAAGAPTHPAITRRSSDREVLDQYLP